MKPAGWDCASARHAALFDDQLHTRAVDSRCADRRPAAGVERRRERDRERGQSEEANTAGTAAKRLRPGAGVCRATNQARMQAPAKLIAMSTAQLYRAPYVMA